MIKQHLQPILFEILHVTARKKIVIPLFEYTFIVPHSTSFEKICLLKVSNECLPGAASEFSKILPQVLHSVFLYLFHSLCLSCSFLPFIVIPHLPFFISPLTSALFFHSLYLCAYHNSYLLWHHANHQHNS